MSSVSVAPPGNGLDRPGNSRPGRALLVLAHPRGDSLTAQIADRAHGRLATEGLAVDLLDLHAEGFDPRMTPADEPDWANRDKGYSAEVKAHMRRIDAADSIVVVFPIWWYAPPAILKGWIDRVWNYGYAYGRSKPRFSGKRIIWIGLAGEPQEGFAEMDELVDRYLRVAISNYCGFGDVSVRLIFNTLAEGVAEESRADHLRNVFAPADGALDDFFGSRAPVGV